MHFSTFGLISALLVSLVAGAPADLEDRSDLTSAAQAPFSCYHAADPDGAEGYCPAVAATGWCECSDSKTYAIEPGPSPCGYTTTPAAGPTILASTNCGAPMATVAASPRTLCSKDICPRFCASWSTPKRSFETLDYNSLTKRWYENPNIDEFPYQLLAQTGTVNICPENGNSYIWKPLRTQYAAALEGLCGCTTIFVASGNGVFSSHIWELDKANKPPRDLQPANYQATLNDLSGQLTPNKAALTGGRVFVIVPMDPDHPNNYLYGQAIVNAMVDTVKTATGITDPNSITITTYVPEDGKRSTLLGTNRLGTASFQYDPAYKNPNTGKTSKAYRVISEGRQLALVENL